jgi:tryptophan halogenase
LIDNLPDQPITEPRYIKFQAGRRKQQWHKNCVSIGLSSGFLEPLESTSIHLIQSGILRLIKNFPLQGINPLQVDNYNDKTVVEIERIGDFIIMHYNVTDRRDTEFCRHCTAMDLSEPLQNKLATFEQTGKVVIEEGEMFGDSWAQVLIGQGLIPDQYHPILKTLSDQELDEFMRGIEHKIDAQLEPHKIYVDAFCAAAPDRRRKPHFC